MTSQIPDVIYHHHYKLPHLLDNTFNIDEVFDQYHD